MFISHKSNVIHTFHEVEWVCRKKAKRFNTPEYGAWTKTITTQDEKGNDVITFPSEDFTIVECTDENVSARLNQLGDYTNSDSRSPNETIVYNIKWSDSKVNCEEVLDIDGKSQSPKVYVKSHFKGNNTAKDARLLADEWTRIRAERTRLLAETDHLALSDQTLTEGMTTHRQKLRDIPTAQGSATKYSEITWPTKP